MSVFFFCFVYVCFCMCGGWWVGGVGMQEGRKNVTLIFEQTSILAKVKHDRSLGLMYNIVSE